MRSYYTYYACRTQAVRALESLSKSVVRYDAPTEPVDQDWEAGGRSSAVSTLWE